MVQYLFDITFINATMCGRVQRTGIGMHVGNRDAAENFALSTSILFADSLT
jgi:hypothetical protein